MSSTKQAWKLPSGKVVITENGVTKVLTPPKGISYSEKSNRWYTSVLHEDTKFGQPIWKTRSFGCRLHGVVGAFEMAVEARERSLSFLLDARMLPRILREYHVLERKGLYVVRDPIEKCYRNFATLEHAKAFNSGVTQEWIYRHTFNPDQLIRLGNNVGEYVSFGGGPIKPYTHSPVNSSQMH